MPVRLDIVGGHVAVMVDLDIVPAHILQNIESRNIGAVHPISLFLQFSQCFT
jgi:hypothetical protein